MERLLKLEYLESDLSAPIHRLIPSRFPPVSLLDWAESHEELEEIAALEGLTNERIQAEYGNIYLISKEDWVWGEGATSLMSAFTHPGQSRFSDGTYGVYYAGESLETAVAETKYHRERFLQASKEPACLIQMREYVATLLKKLINICQDEFRHLLNPDPSQYQISQSFAREIREKKIWGLCYPSVRRNEGKCVAIFRPPALTIPTQSSHLDYIWDGKAISEVRISKKL